MIHKLRICLLFGGCLLTLSAASCVNASRPSFDQAFVFTFIDRAFENEKGGPPFDRALYAKAIDRCRELGAKGVLVKLFLDQEKTGTGDDALAAAMRRIPVILQARIEPQTGLPSELAERFAFPADGVQLQVSGDRGWIPIPKLAATAFDIGFVDFADDHVPLLEGYRGKVYRSVVVSSLELQFGVSAKLTRDGALTINNRIFPTDRGFIQKVVRSGAPLPTVSFVQLLSGQVAVDKIKGRVVILGYTGQDAPIIPTNSGNLDAHVFFGQCLRAIFESVHPATKRHSR